MKFPACASFGLLLLTAVAHADLDCNVDKFHRTDCWQEEGTVNETSCKKNILCCWDSTWVGVPMCFYAIGPTTTTETTAPVTSPQPAQTAESATTAGESSIGETTSSTQSPTTPGIADALDRGLRTLLSNTSNVKPQQLLDLLNSVTLTDASDTELVLEKILSTAIALSSGEVFTGDTEQRVNDWLRFFDDILKVPGIMSSPNAMNFLNASSQVIMGELLSTNTTLTQSAISSVATYMEKYAVAMTTALLSNRPSLVLSYEHNNFTFCNVTTSESSCDVMADYVSSTVGSPESDQYLVTHVTYEPLNVGSSFVASFHDKVSLDTPLYSVALHNDGVMLGAAQVDLTFQTTKGNNAVCAFIDSSTGNWSTEGCIMTSQRLTSASCTCNHNTTFALLFLHSDIKITDGERRVFEIITFIGCGTSITALLLTVFTFLYLRLTRIKRIVLHLHLASTMCMGQIILLLGNSFSVGTIECKVIAVLIHFFFMASFSWMLMEGILLYYQSVRAVSGQVNFNAVLVVGVSLAAGFDGYGKDRGCWLSKDNGLIWAFIGPALGFIAINLILMGMIIHVFMKLKSNSKSGEWERAKRTIRAIAVLTPLLGITWLFGVLAVDESTKWFLYLFSVTNSLQGLFIFIFHCLRNEDVRRTFIKKYRRSVKNMGPFFSTIAPSTGNSGTTFVKNSTSNFVSTPRIPHKSSW